MSHLKIDPVLHANITSLRYTLISILLKVRLMKGENSVESATICISTAVLLSPGKAVEVLYRPFTPSICEVKNEWISTSFLPLCLHGA
jgi:hypothetical protein